jgi:hypothetical protein
MVADYQDSLVPIGTAQRGVHTSAGLEVLLFFREAKG